MFSSVKLLAVAACLSLLLCESAAAETAALKVRFQYGGTPPAIEPVAAAAGECGSANVVDEKLIVDPQTKGIKNVVVYVFTGRGGSELDETQPPKNTVVLANQQCRFDPHVLILRAGDTLQVTNADPFGHNTNLNFFNNKAINFIIPPGAKKDVLVEKAESAPIPIDCNIHSFMKGYIVVLDHSLAAISDDNGELTIEGLPTGKKLVFRAFHEAGSISEVQVDGNPQEWKRNRFDVEIKPGINDLGTVVIPAKTFSK